MAGPGELIATSSGHFTGNLMAQQDHMSTSFEPFSTWDWPVDVTYYEAKAFCCWKVSQHKVTQLFGRCFKTHHPFQTAKGESPTSKPYRLLTKAEHQVIRHKDNNLDAVRRDIFADKVMSTSGEEFPLGKSGANLNLAFHRKTPSILSTHLVLDIATQQATHGNGPKIISIP